MNAFEKFVAFMEGEMTKPTLYGWFHLMWLGIVAVLIALVVITRDKVDEKRFNFILTIWTALLLLFEVYKQVVFSFNSDNGTWSYQWYAFPFQFCSTPMYVLLVSRFVKNEKVLKSIYAYLGTYSLFAGVAVMFYPSTVFIDTIGVNIQTMVHHGSMLVLGVFLYATKRIEFKLISILRALPVFVTLVAVALSLNFIYGDYDTFNMFFIAPGGTCDIPVLNLLHGNVPYVIFLLAYILGFTIVGTIMLLAAIGINTLHQYVKHKTQLCNSL